MKRIVLLTGAGISAESGLATFRGGGGLWEGERVEDVATPAGFRRDPSRVWRFYNARRRQLLDPAVAPNPAHRALARLDREWPGELLLVTQNVDDLHERAGSRRMLHLHGELLKSRCTCCGKVGECRGDLGEASSCTACGERGTLRPHIVWFGEMPFHLEEISSALSRADLFVSIGTSGQVYPAAGFVSMARDAGARTLELNLDPSAGRSDFHEARQGPAGALVPRWVDELLAGGG